MGKSSIYTRTGDHGQTSLVGGTRVSKSSLRLEAYGTVDELNSQLGLLGSLVKDAAEVEFLANIQRQLFKIGALLATEVPENGEPEHLDKEVLVVLENHIDQIDASLPPLKTFILPGGCMAASVAQVCRAVCRRAERRIVSLAEESPVDDVLQCYVNRLSDYLFILARLLNVVEKVEEKKW